MSEHPVSPKPSAAEPPPDKRSITPITIAVCALLGIGLAQGTMRAPSSVPAPTISTTTATTGTLAQKLDQQVKPLAERGDIGLVVWDKRSDTTWNYQGDKLYNMASLVKFSTAMMVLRQAEEQHRELTPEERENIVLALRHSDNDAQDVLWEKVGGAEGYFKKAIKLGTDFTVPQWEKTWGRTLSTPFDQATLMRNVVQGTSGLSSAHEAWLLSVMRGVQEDQHWGAAPFPTKPGLTFAVKNGWYPYSDTGKWRLTSLGYIKDAKHDYVICIMSNNWDTKEQGVPLLDQIGAKTYELLSK